MNSRVFPEPPLSTTHGPSPLSLLRRIRSNRAHLWLARFVRCLPGERWTASEGIEKQGEVGVAEGGPASFAQVDAPFDASAAIVVEDPPGAGAGHWAGAPGAFSDGDTLYLIYRLRWPRPRRGGELRIAQGDGERFQTIWRAMREDFGSQSIERCAILRDGRRWRLYVSSVDEIDGRWRIDVVEAGAPGSVCPAARRPALGPHNGGARARERPRGAA